MEGLPTNEARLISEARQGNAWALDSIYSCYNERVYRLCLRLTANETKAQELVEEVFLRVYRNLERHRHHTNFSVWLYRIAVHVALNHLRNEKSFETMFRELGEANKTEMSPVGAPEPGRRFNSAILRKAIKRLPAKHREVLVLRDLEGYEYKKVAVLLGCSVPQVKSILHRARIRLRDLLQTESVALELDGSETVDSSNREEKTSKSSETEQERLTSRFHRLVDKRIEESLSARESVELQRIEKALQEFEDAQTSRFEQTLKERHDATMQRLTDFITELRRMAAAGDQQADTFTL